jgi:hypothetical protein
VLHLLPLRQLLRRRLAGYLHLELLKHLVMLLLQLLPLSVLPLPQCRHFLPLRQS